jgi:hypothetical protein
VDVAHPERVDGGVDELYDTLQQGYARYRLLMSGLGLLWRWSERRRRPSVVADAAVVLVAGHSAAMAFAHRPGTTRSSAAGWADAVTSAAGSMGSLAALSAGGAAPGVWPVEGRWAPGVAQWSMAGTNLLGVQGSDRLARMAVVAAPFLVWPPGRRWLRESGLLAETAMVLVMFAGAGQAILRGLIHSTDVIDRQRAVQLARHEVDAALAEDEAVRRSVIGRTTQVLGEIRGVLAADRGAAAELAAAEERRLRSWIAGRELPGGREVEWTDADRAPARTLKRFVVTAYGVLRLGAAAQLVFESVSQQRPRSVRLLAAAAAAHAVGTTAMLARRGEHARRAVAMSDIALVSAATTIDAVAARRGRPHGWTRGYVQAMAGSAGAVSAEPVHTRIVAGCLGAVVWIGAGLQSGPLTSAAVLRSTEEASMVAATVQLSGWFRRLVGLQADRLEASTREMSMQRSAAAAADVRRRRQYFVHDSALQVLLWVQKPDLTDDQLLEWIDREMARLSQLDAPSRRAGESPADEELGPALQDLLSGFASLGVRPRTAVELTESRVPPSVLRCVVEVCNESLANVLRHSEDREPSLRLCCDADGVRLEVRSRLPPDYRARAPGTGRSAMRARASEVGGTVEHRREAEWYVVTLDVPRQR